MAISVSRETASTDFILRITDDLLCGVNKVEVISKIVNSVADFMAKEYVEQHQQEILAEVDPKVIINALSIKIAEQVVSALLEKNNEKL